MSHCVCVCVCVCVSVSVMNCRCDCFYFPFHFGGHIWSPRVDLVCVEFSCVNTVVLLPMFGIFDVHIGGYPFGCTWGL